MEGAHSTKLPINHHYLMATSHLYININEINANTNTNTYDNTFPRLVFKIYVFKTIKLQTITFLSIQIYLEPNLNYVYSIKAYSSALYYRLCALIKALDIK